MSICLTSGCVRIWTERRWHIAILRQSPGSTPEHSLTLRSLRADYTWANVMRGLIIVEHRMCGPSSDIDFGLITLGKLLTNGYKSPGVPVFFTFYLQRLSAPMFRFGAAISVYDNPANRVQWHTWIQGVLDMLRQCQTIERSAENVLSWCEELLDVLFRHTNGPCTCRRTRSFLYLCEHGLNLRNVPRFGRPWSPLSEGSRW